MKGYAFTVGLQSDRDVANDAAPGELVGDIAEDVKAATALDFSDLNLHALPAAISTLVSLTSLSFAGNGQLGDAAAELICTSLTQIIALDLCATGLTGARP
jgi:hypothetical protein